jgi:hypothetical protein
MALPGSERHKKLLQEINTGVEEQKPEFLQEIKLPEHEETLDEQPKKRARRSKKK